MAAKLWKRAAVAAKVESVEGTAETLLGTDYTIEAENIGISPDLPFFEKTSVSPSLSKRKGTSGGPRLKRITFETQMRGSGTAVTPASWGVLFKGCAMDETIGASEVDYDPRSDSPNFETLTLAVNLDGVEFKIAGAMGTYRINMTSGEPGRIFWEFLGVYIEPTDVAVPTGMTYDGQVGEAWVNGTGTLGGTAFWFKMVELDIANVLEPRQRPGEAGGAFSVRVTDRVPTYTIDPELEAVATENFFNDLTTNQLLAFIGVINGGGGNTVTVNANVQYEGLEPAERGGIIILNASGRLIAQTDAGDDEINVETK
jgi:hypothetical protein